MSSLMSHGSTTTSSDELITEVFVMLPLDSISLVNPKEINNVKSMQALLDKAKKTGVKGVMVDVWWGLVEREGEKKYEWSGYFKLLEEVTKRGLHFEAIMSFHACGNGPGDNVFIPLPAWVTKIGEANSDIYYKDFGGNACQESLSLGVDNVLVGTRTGLDIYFDFMKSFHMAFQRFFLDGTIVKVNVGCGACGELRYPSYNSLFGWKYPGVGGFQCFDKYMREGWGLYASSINLENSRDLSKLLEGCGKSDVLPQATSFFTDNGEWNSHAGDFFLQWYSRELINHGDRMLAVARKVFSVSLQVKLAVKIPGIHWQYNTLSHAGELTAGFYNTGLRDGYIEIAQMCAKHNALLNFTCLEMTDKSTNAESAFAASSPETLALQIATAAKANISLVGENAMSPISPEGYDQMLRHASLTTRHHPSFTRLTPMDSVTILRAHETLFADPHFTHFVRRMHRKKEYGRVWWMAALGVVGVGVGFALWRFRK